MAAETPLPEAVSRVPSPDPTVLSTEALNREVASLQNEIVVRVAHLQDLIGARLDGMDTATNLRLTELHTVPAKVNEEITHLHDLVWEKFESVAQQFSERDIRTDQASRASKEALDAALLAAKELVGVTNDNITKQIDQIAVLIQSQGQATDARITEIKERIDRGPGEVALQARDNQRYSTNESRLNIGALLGGLSVLLVLVFGVASLIVAMRP